MIAIRLLAVLALLIAGTTVQSQVLAGPSTDSLTFKPQMFKVVVGGELFTLAEVDVGIRFGCGAGQVVGVVLKDSGRIARWSFNLGDTASNLDPHSNCIGTSAASIVGVAVPNNDTALWVTKVLRCGGSCAGYDIHGFSFHPSRKSYILNSSEYDNRTVPEEIHHWVGLGGVKFSLPRLLLYVNDGYKECPSHWTRMNYEWTHSPNTAPKFIPKNKVSYTSSQCYLRLPGESENRHWPPDPGQ